MRLILYDMRRILLFLILFLMAAASAGAFVGTPDNISKTQESISGLPLGQRIAFWAEQFVGTPYDTDPLGAYVRNKVIVYDGAVDCMYHTFRAVELSSGVTPDGAVNAALRLRFKGLGTLDEAGKVTNYDDRFEYAEDMILSGKWGKDITAEIGTAVKIKGARGIESTEILPKDAIIDSIDKLNSGDIIYFIKAVEKRVVGEIVAHLGIIKKEGGKVYLIHASGRKNAQTPSYVKELPFEDYVRQMSFVGIKVTRF
ncbi:hypothetical protein [Candidatus Magnetominusculus dajiuhuensis]|uniref:hypothetical protein n=1 Tax=Candidatus Magnetominusculus dajiuhuensis TaxID=3137712 RepID=UPI003B43AC14